MAPSPVRSSLPAIFFTDDMPRREYPTMFIYGVAGSGKTNVLRTIKHLDPLVFATEDGQTKGMSTLADLKIAALMIDNLDQLIAATSELAARAQPGRLMYGELGPFRALALELTGVGPMLEDAAKKLKGWDMIWDSHVGGGKDPRTAYPYIAEKGRQVVRKLMALPVPLVLSCREQIVTEGEAPNQKSYPAPELPGQRLPKELPGWPEATLRLRMINGVRQFVTEQEGDIVARIRLPEGQRCPKYIKPDLGALIRLLQGDYSALKDLALPKVEVRKTAQQIAAEALAASRLQAAQAVTAGTDPALTQEK